MERIIKLSIHHYNTDEVLKLELPASTKTKELTTYVYEHNFAPFQKPGYFYIYMDHLMGLEHALSDYLPDDAKEMDIKLLNVPYIMV